MKSPSGMSLTGIFADKLILFRYTDKSLELCLRN